MVDAKLGALEKLWFVGVFFFNLWVRQWLPCNMTLSERRVTPLDACHVRIQRLSNMTLKNS